MRNEVSWDDLLYGELICQTDIQSLEVLERWASSESTAEKLDEVIWLRF